MFAISFSRFLELPKELQMQIWEEAIETIPKGTQPVKSFSYFYVEHYTISSGRRDYPANPAHKWVGPQTGNILDWSPEWYLGDARILQIYSTHGMARSDWSVCAHYRSLLNAWCWSRILLLKWMKREVKKVPLAGGGLTNLDLECFKEVLGELIDDLNARWRQ